MFSLLSLKLVYDLVIPALRRQAGREAAGVVCMEKTIPKAPSRISWKVDKVLLGGGVWSV